MVPDERQLFKENALAGLWRTGANKLRRSFPKLAAAGENSNQQGAGDKRTAYNGVQPPVKHQQDVGKAVHDVVSLPDDFGKCHRADEHAGKAAHAGGCACIKKVSLHDLPGGVAQRFQGAYLSALFVHHAVHGGHAHQSCHQEEEYREDLRHAFNYAGVVFEAGIAGVGISVKNVNSGLLYLAYLGFGHVELYPAIGERLLGVVKLGLGLSFCGFIVFAARFKLLKSGGILIFALLKSGAAAGQLGLSGDKLLL